MLEIKLNKNKKITNNINKKGDFFMKKILILISLIIISLSSYKSFNEEIVIPDEAIRFRVVAKSNDEKDQEKTE